MKNSIIILSILLFAQIGFSQAPPQGINYQAVVYSDYGNNQPGLNVPGQLLLKKSIRVRFTIIANATNGNEVYKESHATTTDAFGMFSIVIGQGTQEGSNSFQNINWGTGNHFLKVEIDKSGGTNYITMSNQQLWSVPYALYSGKSGSSDNATNSAHADSSDYSDLAGNGITGVTDNGNGTLTFTYLDGSSYTTGVLSGLIGAAGPQGPQGPAGQNGQSAYELWLAQGNTGTQQDFLNSITGPQGLVGQNGLSAYEIWLGQGNTGTEQDFLNSLVGPQGPSGTGINYGPTFINPINIINKSGNQIYQNLSIISDIQSYLGITVSSVILSVEFNGYFGGSNVGTNILAEVNAICGNNTYKVVKSKYTDSNYASNSISDRQQIILPVVNGQITFTVPTWTNSYGQSLLVDIVGYYN